MKTLKDIQGIIREKAEKRLRDDISKVLNAVRGDLVRSVEECTITYKEKSEPKTCTFREFFWNDGPASRAMFDANINSYIERESEDFMDSIRGIQEQVDELLNKE